MSSVGCYMLSVECRLSAEGSGPPGAADLPGQRILGYLSAFARDVQRFLHKKHESTRFPRAEDTIHTSQFIFRTKDTNIHDFRKWKKQFVLYDVSLHERHEYTRFPRAEDTICSVRCFFARKTRIYTISASGRHDSSFDSCPKNRGVDLSTSYHSYHSCYERIVASTYRHRIIRA